MSHHPADPGPTFEPPASGEPGWGQPHQPSAEPTWGQQPAQSTWGQQPAQPVWGQQPEQPAWGQQSAAQPGASTWGEASAQSVNPAAVHPTQAAPAPATPMWSGGEKVGLGLAAAAAVVVGCCALTVLIYHWGFIASITAWLMAVGAAGAYQRFAGVPVKGRLPLFALIVVGIFLGFLSMVGSVIWGVYWNEAEASGTNAEAMALVLDNLFNVGLWGELGKDALFYFLFAGLGAFGVLRRMGRGPSGRSTN